MGMLIGARAAGCGGEAIYGGVILLSGLVGS